MIKTAPLPAALAPVAALPRTRWPLWLVGAGLCVVLAMAGAVLWAALWQRQALQASLWPTQHSQQRAVAQTWARLLSERLDSQRRALVMLAQAMPASEAEQALAVDVLVQQEGSLLSLLESLHIVRADGSARDYAVGAEAKPLSPAENEAVRSTLHDGKLRISTLGLGGEGLQLLLAAPLRSSEGLLASAMAVRVRWPQAWVMPLPPQSTHHFVYQLLDERASVLAQSTAVTLEQSQALRVLAQHGPEWRAWPRSSASSAQAQQWGPWLVVRAALPQAQWEAVVVSAVPTAPWMAGMPWLKLGVGWLALLALGGWGVWRCWLRWGQGAPPPAAPAHYSASARAPAAQASSPLAMLAPDAGGGAPLPTYGRAMLDMAPVPLLAVQGDTVRLCNVHVQYLLGYSAQELEGQHVSVLFCDVEALVLAERQVRDQIHHTGSYTGLLMLRRRDGSTLAVQLQAQWVPSNGPYTLWRLRPPSSLWRRSVWPAQAATQAQAERDHLTRLPNRTALGWQLQAWVAKATPLAAAAAPPAASAPADTAQAWQQVPAKGCFLVLDVDHLGALNEVASRAFGDSVLAHVGQLLNWQLRSVGWVARLGGDEFVAVLPGLSLAHAQMVAQQLCHAVHQWRPLWREEAYTVSVSVGAVAVDVLRHDLHQALRAADMACYEAKRRGRGQVVAGQVSNAHVQRKVDAI